MPAPRRHRQLLFCTEERRAHARPRLVAQFSAVPAAAFPAAAATAAAPPLAPNSVSDCCCCCCRQRRRTPCRPRLLSGYGGGDGNGCWRSRHRRLRCFSSSMMAQVSCACFSAESVSAVKSRSSTMAAYSAAETLRLSHSAPCSAAACASSRRRDCTPNRSLMYATHAGSRG